MYIYICLCAVCRNIVCLLFMQSYVQFVKRNVSVGRKRERGVS